jgi:hypothetical protein
MGPPAGAGAGPHVLKGYPRGPAQPSELRTHTDFLEVRWPVKNLPRFKKTRERDYLSTLNRKPNKLGKWSTPRARFAAP